MSVKRIAVVGSTGSIGRQALEIIAGEEGFRACGLAAGSNAGMLAEQARAFRPEAVAIADESLAGGLAAALPKGTELLSGPGAAAEMVRRLRPETVVAAVVGSAGLDATLAAIECGADLALANKESLVMAGAVVMPAARAAGVNVIPVDSEHSAIFQCLGGRGTEGVRRIILTASGGPLRHLPPEKVPTATLEEVLNHPTWRMGRKITIDSATMMNKAFEIIEAHWLFGLPAERIEAVIHPESVVHGCVEFTDGSVLAQLGTPAMTTPISLALYYPGRAPSPPAPLDLTALGGLHFQPLDERRYPAVRLAREVIARGGTAGAALAAADEVAVEAFVAGRIPFGAIVDIAEEVLNRTPAATEIDIDVLRAADADARRRAGEIVVRGAYGNPGL